MNHRGKYSDATHCIHGHEFTPENTYYYTKPDGKTRRSCITCRDRVSQERSRDNHLRRLYGFSEAEYNEMYLRQNGTCAICCKVPEVTGKNSRLHVDHNHRTGKVRGLLCYGCNIAMGFIGEDPEKLMKILDYLNFHEFSLEK